MFFFDYNNVISLAALGDLGAVYSAAVAEVDCLWRGWEVLRRFGSECSSARAVAARLPRLFVPSGTFLFVLPHQLGGHRPHEAAIGSAVDATPAPPSRQRQNVWTSWSILAWSIAWRSGRLVPLAVFLPASSPLPAKSGAIRLCPPALAPCAAPHPHPSAPRRILDHTPSRARGACFRGACRWRRVGCGRVEAALAQHGRPCARHRSVDL